MHIRRKEPKPNHLRELKPPASLKTFRTSMKDVRKATTEMFKGVLPTLQSYINSATDAEGKLIPSRRNEVARISGEAVHRLFVGPDGRSAFASDGVSALAPFGQLLNEYYVRVTLEAIYTQRNWMKKNMPPELFNWLARQQFFVRLGEAENPFIRQPGEDDEAFMQRMRDLRIFHPNPMAELDPNRQWVPMHLWQDSRGYQLSQRIWNAGNNTRRKVDEIITEAFNEGWGALELSRRLEQFLLPERASLRTNRPYGSDGSFDAMRLARTEIARAANQAAYVSAYLNPYVSKIDVARSRNGDVTCRICPQHATIGMGGERIRPPYSIHSADIPVYHPHCVTPGQLVTTMRGKIPIEDVQIGDYVLTHKGRFRRVINAWSRPYSGLVHDIQTRLGRAELTSEHPILSSTGWINADSVKLGEQVLHASINVLLDLVLSVSKCHPTEPFKVGISDSVPVGLMPTASIAFNGNFALNKSEVKRITPDAILPFIFDFGLIKSNHHGFFNRCGNSFAPIFENLSASSYESRVMNFFSSRNFGANFWPFRWILIPAECICRHVFSHLFGIGFCTSSIILRPFNPNCITFGTHFKTKVIHNSSECSVLKPDHFSTYESAYLLFIVEMVNNFFGGFTKFLRDSLNILHCLFLCVAGSTETAFAGHATNDTRSGSIRGIGTGITPTITTQTSDVSGKAWLSANVARCGIAKTHDNLLLLSPDFSVGIPSGNGSVERVAIPPQAQLNYSTVERISTLQYDGLVYNMSVEEDESYVVGDMVVHNCMCHVRPVVDDDPATVTQRLQAVMDDSRASSFTAAVSPANVNAFTNMLMHRALGSLVGQVRGQLPLLGF